MQNSSRKPYRDCCGQSSNVSHRDCCHTVTSTLRSATSTEVCTNRWLLTRKRAGSSQAVPKQW